MPVDPSAFSFIPALAGGALIGAAAVLLLGLCGRIAGISGIVGGLMAPQRGDAAWRIAFVAGLMLAPLIYSTFAPISPVSVQTGHGMLVTAGLLVGFGTRLGSGCTSGHGVCGVSRLSRRSLAATATFMVTAFLTANMLR